MLSLYPVLCCFSALRLCGLCCVCTSSGAHPLWKQHFTPMAKWCWPLWNLILANRVSLFKDNSWATSLVRPMMLLACWVPAALLGGCWTGDDSFLFCCGKTWVTGFCFSCCNKMLPAVIEFYFTDINDLAEIPLIFVTVTWNSLWI